MLTWEQASVCVRVWTFGEFAVERRTAENRWEAIPLEEWGGNTYSRRLLKVLLCHERSAHRGTLLSEIWPRNESMGMVEEYLSKAARNLRVVLHSQEQGELLKTIHQRTMYVLADQSRIWTDAQACEDLLHEAERVGRTSSAGLALLQEARGYFARGKFLEGEDGLWCLGTRGRLETAQYRGTLWMAEAYEAQGELQRAEEQMRKLFEQDPRDEDVLCRLMQLLHQQGMTHQALRLYQETQRVLAQEGSQLSPAMEAVAKRLKSEPRPAHIAELRKLPSVPSSTEDILDRAESIINLAWEAWFASRPKQATREITKLLLNLERIISMPLAAIHALRAKELVIRCHGLLGVMYLDALQNDTALYHYIQAHQLAEKIHDTNLAVTYLALMGDVLRRQNDKATALSYMENARDQATNADRATLGHILQLLAYTYSDIGNETAFEQTISEATDLLAFTGEGRDIAKKEFIPFEIYEIRGKANRDLGKPWNAISYLELAEKSLNKAELVTPRWQALLEISRGQVCCDAGDITAGADLITRGFILAHQCHSPHQMNRVRKLLRKLERGSFRNHPKVQDLKNLLSETYIGLDNDTI